MAHFDVIVAGLGAMGSAALDHLAARGVEVLGIEPFGVPHGHGSSGGETRLIRKAYFEHPDYVPLLQRAYGLWRELESDTGESLLHTAGILYLGPPDSELIAGSSRSAAEHGLTLDSLAHEDLQREFPRFSMPAGYAARFEPEAGFLLCERAVRAQVARALRRGAKLAVGERVIRWASAAGAVTVWTETGHHSADSLVLTAGSWSQRLLGDLVVPLTVTRQLQCWLQPAEPAPFTLGQMPCFAVQPRGAAGLYYGIPALPSGMGRQLGVKLAHHYPGPVVDPDQPVAPVPASELADVLRVSADFVDGLIGHLTGFRVCLYTSTADGHFLVDTHPACRNVVFGCGFSGHGFKFAPVIGQALADLALQGGSDLPIGFLGLR